MLNFADYANRVRCGGPLPSVHDDERAALRYFLELEALRDEHIMETPGMGYRCGDLRTYTTGNIRRLRSQAAALKA